MGDPTLCCEEDFCGVAGVERLAVSRDDDRVRVLRQEMWRAVDGVFVPTGVWETDPEAGIVIGADHLPALINALLRLCTHAQLGEVVVLRRAGEWERCGDLSERVNLNGDVCAIGQVMLTGTTWLARTWKHVVGKERVARTTHATRVEAEAAVDERLRADGVVLP